MLWAERIAAGLVALVCLIFLIRLLLPAPAQQRWDAAMRRALASLQARWRTLRQWPQSRQQQKVDQAQAEKLAREAIDKARRGVERDGNVIRPKASRAATTTRTEPQVGGGASLQAVGDTPVQRRKARVKALTSANPSRYAMSLMLWCGWRRYSRAS